MRRDRPRAPSVSGTATSTAYCYDDADRLTATTVTNPRTGATPLTGISLSATTLVYDGSGNTATLADQNLVLDSAGRHVPTTTTGGTYTKWTGDATGRILQRGSHATSTAMARHGFTGSGDSVDLLPSSSNEIAQRELSLPGGVLVSLPVRGAALWSYPNVHGDVITSADATGVGAAVISHEPYGQPIDPATGAIGTQTADDSAADNLPNNFDYSWVGSNQKLYEHTGTLAFIEMGARVYLTALGRFTTTTDPIEGGSDYTYTYTYVNGPIKAFDLTGMFDLWTRVKVGVAGPGGGWGCSLHHRDGGCLREWNNRMKILGVAAFATCVIGTARACLWAGVAGSTLASANATLVEHMAGNHGGGSVRDGPRVQLHGVAGWFGSGVGGRLGSRQ